MYVTHDPQQVIDDLVEWGGQQETLRAMLPRHRSSDLGGGHMSTEPFSADLASMNTGSFAE